MFSSMFSRKKTNPKQPVKTIYRSNEVAIPADYLKTDPHDAKPITFSSIDFASSVLPEFKGCYAVVLDHVLSPTECAQLLELAESSVMDEDKGADGSSWRPALVNVGGGYEVQAPGYRNGDRIIWDSQVVVDRLWDRLATVPQINEKLASFSADDLPGAGEGTYDFGRVNNRMRFLKYDPGGFFRPHCDGPYGEPTADGGYSQTYFTVHLYLNDSQQEVGEEAELRGGATSFLSRDGKRKMDIDPKAGRVLIFQHSRLRHSGDNVTAGIKYTVRTDIMYRLREDR
ncbi:Uu.00g096700.m01.CDS01 [Anthostomella pinea]|uniref:Uu.00g096700.m01.CDS01 n=1 Tax=Anthostomella pinea TaxID=933095 RepID=A0AAI8YEV9_9PEZI|nr:Uu.00g096700.m01.CDS01 [Anthostomella pinea]